MPSSPEVEQHFAAESVLTKLFAISFAGVTIRQSFGYTYKRLIDSMSRNYVDDECLFAK